jgi:anti-sigma factor RsiW
MNCSETAPLLHAYADGELDLVRSLDVEQHVKSCAACSASAQALQSLRTLFRSRDLAYTAPKTLRRRVCAGLRESTRETRSQERRSWLWQMLAAGATAIAVFALILRPVGFSENERIVDEAVSGHIRSLMSGHLTDVASSDQHTVKPWFQGKVDFAPDVKDFVAQGFRLVGGRLDYFNDQPVAAVVYRRNLHLINVFIWPAKSALPEHSRDYHGFRVLSRHWKNTQYLIVSDLNQKELSEFAALLGQP